MCGSGRAARGWGWLLALAVGLAACSGSAELLGRLPEADANEAVAALADAGIEARKHEAKSGFSVTVDSPQFARAVAVLKLQGLPRNAYAAMGDVFKKDGMISTPLEERGRYLYALSQGLEDTLGRIDGVVLARVHPVLPERVAPGEPVLPSSCAVLIKHRPGWDSSRYEQRVRQLVVASIPGLAEAGAAKVSIVFVPADEAAAGQAPAAAAAAQGGQAGSAAGTGTASPAWAVAVWIGALLAGLAGLALAGWVTRQILARRARTRGGP